MTAASYGWGFFRRSLAYIILAHMIPRAGPVPPEDSRCIACDARIARIAHWGVGTRCARLVHLQMIAWAFGRWAEQDLQRLSCPFYVRPVSYVSRYRSGVRGVRISRNAPRGRARARMRAAPRGRAGAPRARAAFEKGFKIGPEGPGRPYKVPAHKAP